MPLNEGWRKEVEKFLTEHPGTKLDHMTLMDYWLVLIMAPSNE